MKKDTPRQSVGMGLSVTKLTSLLYKIRDFMGTSLARWIVLGLFVVQAGILVFTVQIGTPPDETNDIQFIQYYANHSLSPTFTKQQPTYYLGDKTREVDYLYHYAMSLVVRVLPLSPVAEDRAIRLISVAVGLLGFLTLAKVLKLLGLSAAVITASFLLLTNLPMVLLMSSAINNDVFVWLGMALGMLLLLRLWKKPSAIDMTWLMALSLIGGLVKRTLLPLGMIFVVLGAIIFVRNTRTILAGFKRFNWRLCLAAVVFLIGLGLFTERVGGNLIHYGSVTVTCEQVHGTAPCYDFWSNVRARGLAQLPPQPSVPIPFFVVRWLGESFFNIVDIQTQGWHHTVRPARALVPLLVFLLIGGLVYGFIYEKKRFAGDEISRHRVYIALIALFFVLVHMATNYSTYRHVKVFGIALNGRYILPSVLPLAVLSGFYWSRLLARRPRLLVVLAIGVVLFTILGSGLLVMFRNPQLYTGQ